jgi:hypothetical protein
VRNEIKCHNLAAAAAAYHHHSLMYGSFKESIEKAFDEFENVLVDTSVHMC